MKLAQLIEQFHALYPGKEPRFFYAPARVNLIGEHIDYSGGQVLPAALTQFTLVLAAANDDRVIRVAAEDLPGAQVCAPLTRLKLFRGKGWGAYQLGAADALLRAGYPVAGCDMLYYGTVPFGSGLSSSASIEVAAAVALCALSPGLDAPSMPELAVLAQQAENEFVGLNCGIMDQFASACGREGHAMLLDCATLAHTYVPLELGSCTLVIINTNKPRGLADSKYNERREESERALVLLRGQNPSLSSLCALKPAELHAQQALFDGDPVAYARARHAVEENARTLASAEALQAGDLRRFGQLMNASHESLRDLYQVTGEHLDALYDAARSHPATIGARMTGAGFGGCTVNLVETAGLSGFVRHVERDYMARCGIQPCFYFSRAGRGAGELSPAEAEAVVDRERGGSLA